MRNLKWQEAEISGNVDIGASGSVGVGGTLQGILNQIKVFHHYLKEDFFCSLSIRGRCL